MLEKLAETDSSAKSALSIFQPEPDDTLSERLAVAGLEDYSPLTGQPLLVALENFPDQLDVLDKEPLSWLGRQLTTESFAQLLPAVSGPFT